MFGISVMPTFNNPSLGKGFFISFGNGLTLSTQIGPGSYSENFEKSLLYTKKLNLLKLVK